MFAVECCTLGDILKMSSFFLSIFFYVLDWVNLLCYGYGYDHLVLCLLLTREERKVQLKYQFIDIFR